MRQNVENPRGSIIDQIKKPVTAAVVTGLSLAALTGCSKEVVATPGEGPGTTTASPTAETPVVTESPSSDPTPTMDVSQVPSPTPTGIDTLTPTPTANETQDSPAELTPLREWSIDSSLFETWELLTLEEKQQKAHEFFIANISDARYTPRFDANVVGRLDMEQTTLSTFAELSTVSDLYMDGTLGEGGKLIAGNLLDVVAHEEAKDKIIEELESEWGFFNGYDDCGGCTLDENLRRLNHINEVLKTSPDVMYDPDNDIYTFTAAVGLYFNGPDKWYDSNYGIVGASIDINSRQIDAIGWGEQVIAKFYPEGESQPIGQQQEVVDYLADAPHRSK